MPPRARAVGFWHVHKQSQVSPAAFPWLEAVPEVCPLPSPPAEQLPGRRAPNVPSAGGLLAVPVPSRRAEGTCC